MIGSITRPLTRLYGGLTVAYGVYALARPGHLSHQTGIDPDTGARLGRLIGLRDISSGAMIALASSPEAARRALYVRAALDALDVAGFGTLSPLPAGRGRVAAVGSIWGGLALLLAQRTRGSTRWRQR